MQPIALSYHTKLLFVCSSFVFNKAVFEHLNWMLSLGKKLGILLKEEKLKSCLKFWLVSVGGKIKRPSNIREYLLFFCLTVLMGWWNPRSCFVGDGCSLYSKSWGNYFYAHNWQLPQFSWFLLCHNMFVFLCVRSVKLTYHGCLLLLSLLKNSMEGLHLCLVLISIY